MSFKIIKAKNLRGAGDVVAMVAQPAAKIIDALTRRLPDKLRTNVAGCGRCKQRQARLNEILPFKH